MNLTSSAFQRLGFYTLIFFLFLIYSRIFDVKFAFLHIPGIAYRVIAVMVVLSRCFTPALRCGTGKAMLGFTIWFGLAIPFSVWRGGSFALFRDSWLLAFVVYLATAGLVVTYKECRRAVYTVAVGFFVLTLIAIIWGNTSSGRLYLPQGKFANPNEMAQALLVGLPLWGAILLNARSFVHKSMAAGVMLVMLLTATRTGSRGAMVAFSILLLAMFLRSTAIGKLKMLVTAMALILLIVVTMPGKLLNRYATLTEDQSDDPVVSGYDNTMDSNAIASVKSRKQLLRESLIFTVKHPLFGVGPGMFTVAEDASAKSAGSRGTWQGTHNSYTQVSSEVGIPALAFYLAVIILALRNTARLYQQTRKDTRFSNISNVALCLNYSLIVFVVTIFFDYIAYTSMLSVLAGLAVALTRTAEIEMARLAAAPPPPAPIPFPAFRSMAFPRV